MRITVKYFALLREAAGREEEKIEVPGTASSLGGLLGVLESRSGALAALLRERPLLCAVNGEYAGREETLAEGDEVALFPPVSGG